MRLWSTDNSVEMEEISALAVGETLLAAVISYLIYWRTGSIIHIAVSASLAPFLLLRTKYSTELGLRFGNWASLFVEEVFSFIPNINRLFAEGNYSNYVRYSFIVFLTPLYVLFLLTYVIVTLILFTLCKVAATILGVLRHPLESLGSIAYNWRKAVLYVDIMRTPELIPGVEGVPDNSVSLKYIKEFKNSQLIHNLIYEDLSYLKFPGRYLIAIAYCAGMVFLVIPAIVYRLSLKSTSVLWSPLLWVVRPAADASSIVQTMQRLVRRDVMLVTRVYSVLIIALFFTKLFLSYHWAELRVWIEPSMLWSLVAPLVAPNEIPWWQLAALTNAFLTIALYVAADYYLKELQIKASIPEHALQSSVKSVFIIRNILSIYTMLCTIYIVITNVDYERFPVIGTKLFPWLN
ncbi:hypothetical protein [Microvirga lotononidis]|uniref:Uncharacterized protein n=1 Tax=Microvirga lotononidis TaxID=864069 RepID=I4YTA1_9HYPH|nr:hypothetical protein [Microvirga lotononidis]EIM27193.1 hypothetical protein MicloDRAFT_00037490 [Microvirga lotononidis]WQO28627.1 hypothetical protein U0023_06000 [Microvirga lotononidis]